MVLGRVLVVVVVGVGVECFVVSWSVFSVALACGVGVIVVLVVLAVVVVVFVVGVVACTFFPVGLSCGMNYQRVVAEELSACSSLPPQKSRPLVCCSTLGRIGIHKDF